MTSSQKQKKRARRLMGFTLGVCLVTIGIYIGKPTYQETTLPLTPSEKTAHPGLTKTKIVTLQELKGVFQTNAFKLTGFEETGRRQTEQVTDIVREVTVESSEPLFLQKGKEWLNEANKRELVATFTVDYGLGFDMEPILQNGIQVDEYKGTVEIETPPLQFTHFYLDPTYHLEEDNGVLVSLFQDAFTKEEKQVLIKKMEARIKQSILEDVRLQQRAQTSTKEQLTRLLEEVNPNITVHFREGT